MSDFARLATQAMIQAQRNAAKENARFNLPLIVVKNGRIVRIPTTRRKRR